MPTQYLGAAERLEALFQVSRILSSSLQRDQVLESLLDQAVQVLGAERGYVVMREPESEEWQILVARALDRKSIEAEDFQISRGIVARVSSQGLAVLTSDAMHDERFQEQTSVGLYNLRSILCVPLFIQARVGGVLYLDHRMEEGAFTAQDRELLESIAAQASISLENARLYENLQKVSQLSLEQARRELAQTQAQLVESSKLAALGQLAAGVAHEINNPLGAIALNLSSLKRNEREPVEIRRFEIMEQALQRCRETIDRLLRFAHPGTPDQVGVVDLGQVVSDGLALLEPEFRRHQICLEEQLEKELHVAGQPQEFAQVALNLFLNAIDALRVGTEVPRRLQVRAWRQAQQVFLAVRDNGSGMDEATQKRIFEPFFTTKEVGQGVGLGLSVTHRLLQDRGGRIKVESQPGQGTTFQVALPAVG